MLKEWKKWVSEDSGVDTTARCKPLGASSIAGSHAPRKTGADFAPALARGAEYRHRAQAPPSGESTLPREIAFDMPELQHAAELVHRVLPPTPQYAWPKLARRAGCTLW